MSEPASSYTSERVHRSQRLHAILYRYRNILRKHWWIPVLAIIIALVIQAVRVARTPPTFISIGQMIVNSRVTTPMGSVQAVITPIWENFLGTESTLMQSQRVLDRAAQLVRDRKPNLTPSFVSIKPTVAPKTTLFNLVAIGSDPIYTQAYLDAVMDAYLQVRQEMKDETADAYIIGLRRELIRLQKELARGEQEKLDFQSSNSIVVLQQQGGKASSYLVELDNDLARLKTEYSLLKTLSLDQSIEMQRQLSADAKADSRLPREVDSELRGATDDYLKLKQQLLLKKAEQKQLSEYLRPKHPKMIAIAQDVSDQENLLQILRDQSGEQLTNNLTSLERRIRNTEGEIEEQKIKSLDISRQMAKYEKIQSELERNKESYDRLRATLQSLDVTKVSDAATVTLFKRASNAEPNTANLFKMFLIGVLAGLAVGGLTLFLMDRLDDRLSTFVELQDSFDESVLGQIPEEKSPVKNAPIRLLQTDDNRHAFVEAYRNLRSSLLYMATEGRRAKTLLVTSAVPSDGKSLTTANLAITLSQSGARVLLVDADLRKGLLHRHFSVETSTGLTEILTAGLEWQKAVIATQYPKLSIIPRGAVCKNPGELFLRPATYQMLNEMAGQYDYVIIDSAPVMAADDVASLSPHVEGVIFVIRANSTSARVARAALDLLYQREVNILGIVFNGVEVHTSEYYFYKYKEYHGSRAKA